MAASASITDNYPVDITECPCCHKTLDDPRQLPCIHTVCQKCIRELIENRKPDAPDQTVQCPRCAGICLIPESSFPRDTFVESLIETKKLTSLLSRDVVFCDVCNGTDDEQVDGRRKKAVAYCVQCCRGMCEQCRVCHQKFKFPAGHKLVALGRESGRLEELLAGSSCRHECAKHVGETLKLYCFDCRLAVCLACFVSEHKLHRCSEFWDVSGDLKIEMKIAGDRMRENVEKCRRMQEKIASGVDTFLANMENTRKEIIDKADEMKKMIEDHKSKLLGELDEVKSKHMKQLSRARQDVEARVLMVESFKRYVDELTSKGTDYHIAMSASAVRQREKELVEFDVEEQTVLSCVGIKFTSTGSVDNLKQLFGQLEMCETVRPNVLEVQVDGRRDKATLLLFPSLPPAYDPILAVRPRIIGSDCGLEITGIATLGEEVFVARWNLKHIEVYDASALTSTRQLPLPANATGKNRGVAACSVNKCVYVSDQNSKSVHRVSLDGATSASWSVGYTAYGISVNTLNNLLVACYDGNRILEFTSTGTLVRHIVLQSGVTNPTDVIELPSGLHGVTHQHRYCIVDVNGQMVRSFNASNAAGCGDSQLNNANCFTVANSNTVFIADVSNNRIMQLDSTSFTAKPLTVDIEGGLQHPYSVHYDKSRARLYVGECLNSRRLLVFSCQSADLLSK